jgi:hypothetical protein
MCAVTPRLLTAVRLPGPWPGLCHRIRARLHLTEPHIELSFDVLAGSEERRGRGRLSENARIGAVARALKVPAER